jgi:hypothetical protein
MHMLQPRSFPCLLDVRAILSKLCGRFRSGNDLTIRTVVHKRYATAIS